MYKLKKSSCQIHFLLTYSDRLIRGIIIYGENTMKSLAYTLVVLFAGLTVAQAAKETPKEEFVEEVAVEVPANEAPANELPAEEPKK